MANYGPVWRSLVGTAAATALLAGGAQAGETVESGISTEYEQFDLVRVAGDLEHPWSVAFLPGGGYLVTERTGALKHIRRNGEVREVAGVPDVVARDQGGLLDVSLHPDFRDNGWVYLTYSSGDEDQSYTALGRGLLEDGELHDFEKLFEQDRGGSNHGHFGSRLAWLSDGTLLMTIGDRRQEEPAQDLSSHTGKLLRLTEDGEAPADNPFADRDDAQPHIYAYGLRNSQGLVVDPADDTIWLTDHGPRGGDELNRMEAGGNYGWPGVTRGREYPTERPFGDARQADDVIPPVYEFLPTLAPSGLALVTSDRFEAWEGNLLAGGLRAERILRIVIEDDEVVHMEELLHGKIGRIRDVRESPNGHIYVLTDESDGGLYRMEAR
ncbi:MULTISPECIES: PQQ-dependent sugar dehydrogenase [unclassified Thioalkalivibrio]|uniref:PQQ-dependent sugar dehydrogenase n=1 Tax=unclassified Thioalkalivibrio TaxID=2621013 RepID=UPI00037ABB06|nr:MULTISPECIES: PQQ-dependent sugar dehydrogenase [unclassified Thioalkalivibrio]